MEEKELIKRIILCIINDKADATDDVWEVSQSCIEKLLNIKNKKEDGELKRELYKIVSKYQEIFSIYGIKPFMTSFGNRNILYNGKFIWFGP
jgi:hypothetical protein